MNWGSWILKYLNNPFIAFFVVAILFAIALLGLSRSYYEFLISGRNKWRLVAPLALISSIIGFGILILINKTPFSSIFSMIFSIVFSVSLLRLGPPKCEKKEKEKLEIDGTKIYVCQTKRDYSNAWYDAKSKAIYVTERLTRILNKNELMTVLKHELGHKHLKIYLFFRFLVVASSLLCFSFVVLLWLLILLAPKLFPYYIMMILLFVIVAISSSVILWIDEHEADKYSVSSKEDFEDFARALTKIQIDNLSNKQLRPFIKVKSEKIKELLEFNLSSEYRFQEFFKDFISYFRTLVFSVTDIFHKEIIITHPIWKFRIFYLLNNVKGLKVKKNGGNRL